MKFPRKFRSLTTAIAVFGFTGVALLVAPSAYAVSYHCSGNACAGVAATSGNSVIRMNVYPPEVQFTGHYQLQTPDHQSLNTIDVHWNFQQVRTMSLISPHGSFCVNGWVQTGPSSWQRSGGICFNG
jgi:hypothetical protein